MLKGSAFNKIPFSFALQRYSAYVVKASSSEVPYSISTAYQIYVDIYTYIYINDVYTVTQYIYVHIYIDVRRYVCMYTDIVYIRCITIKIL